MNDYSRIITAVRAIAKDAHPDIDISRILYEHGCFYLLAKIKEENEYTQKLKKDLILNRICIKERYTACKTIFELMERQGIPYAVIKGAVLSQAAYGDIFIRKSGDIDLLIRRGDIDMIKKIMLQNGFVQGRVTDNGIVPFTRQELIFQTGLSHQTAPFIKESCNPLCPYINVDVNTNILWGEYKKQADMDFVLSMTENAEIFGISVKKLSLVIEFIALCLHHYKDMNSIYLLSKGSLKLSLFCDIYFYLKTNRLDINQLRIICEKLEVIEFVYYCIYYANKIFKDELLLGYLPVLKSGNPKFFNTFGLDEQERRKWTINFEERLFCKN